MKSVGLDVDGTLVEFGDAFIDLCKTQNINLKVGKIWNFFDDNPRSYDVFKI